MEASLNRPCLLNLEAKNHRQNYLARKNPKLLNRRRAKSLVKNRFPLVKKVQVRKLQVKKLQVKKSQASQMSLSPKSRENATLEVPLKCTLSLSTKMPT